MRMARNGASNPNFQNVFAGEAVHRGWVCLMNIIMTIILMIILTSCRVGLSCWPWGPPLWGWRGSSTDPHTPPSCGHSHTPRLAPSPATEPVIYSTCVQYIYTVNWLFTVQVYSKLSPLCPHTLALAALGLLEGQEGPHHIHCQAPEDTGWRSCSGPYCPSDNLSHQGLCPLIMSGISFPQPPPRPCRPVKLVFHSTCVH